ncbi:zinc ribbon domain-containing protein, partial [Mitsuokella jalaludinii]
MYGKNFVTVDSRNTTRTCHACGHIMSGKEKLTLKDR